MDKEKMYAYEAPQVEIVEVEVEKGFATSNDDGDAGGEGSDMGWG